MPNLEADVLVTNPRMLTLLRARGYASLPSEDWVSLRLMVGTAGLPRCGPKVARAGPTPPGRGCWSRRPAAAGAAAGEAAGLTFISSSGPRGPRPHALPWRASLAPLAAEAERRGGPPLDVASVERVAGLHRRADRP